MAWGQRLELMDLTELSIRDRSTSRSWRRFQGGVRERGGWKSQEPELPPPQAGGLRGRSRDLDSHSVAGPLTSSASGA